MRRAGSNHELLGQRGSEDTPSAEVDRFLRLHAPGRAISRVEFLWKAYLLQLREAVGGEARRVGKEPGRVRLPRDARPFTAEDIKRAYNKLTTKRSQKATQ